MKIDEIDTKQLKIHRKIHVSLWILKISRKTEPNQTKSLTSFVKCL